MSNLPPGVTESMIPGNRPEDLAYERFWDSFAERLMAAVGDELGGQLANDQKFIDVIDELVLTTAAESVSDFQAQREMDEFWAHADEEADGDS